MRAIQEKLTITNGVKNQKNLEQENSATIEE